MSLMRFSNSFLRWVAWSWMFLGSLSTHPMMGQEAASLTFTFKTPQTEGYQVRETDLLLQSHYGLDPWVDAVAVDQPTVRVQIGKRLHLRSAVSEPDWDRMIAGYAITLHRNLGPCDALFEASTVLDCVNIAQALSLQEGIQVSCPVFKRLKSLRSVFSPVPEDPLFNQQWNIDNRDSAGEQLIGPDLNLRTAWLFSKGEGVVVAVADDGVDFSHPDLSTRQADSFLSYHFVNDRPEVMPVRFDSSHATAVAGLVAAEQGNMLGISGVAPSAKLASWVLFQGVSFFVSDEALMDMFQFRIQDVFVQNHSWGNAIDKQLTISELERLGLSKARTEGRNKRGVIMVRAAGNGRANGHNSNDDGYLTDPGVIPVAAIRRDGKAARFSNPGANILVAAPSGDINNQFDACLANAANIITTDRPGSAGFNRRTSTLDPDLGSYVADENFIGTSASAPQISGLAALLLSVNPNLTYRDVQQILVLSSRHYAKNDPDLKSNGAGLLVGHHLGFGIPDAGEAVRLARDWRPRPALKEERFTSNQSRNVPDLGMKLEIRIKGSDRTELFLNALPSVGIHPGKETPWQPLADVGEATKPLSEDLTGRTAYIKRAPNVPANLSENFFCSKIKVAEEAGASFAVIYNDRDGDQRITMAGTEFSGIPAVFISLNDSQLIQGLLNQGVELEARVVQEAVQYEFQVPLSWQCEHVGVKINGLHSARGDLRITLTSPTGLTSVLQTVNPDTSLGPRNWTYYSTHHFFESAKGNWVVRISDEDSKGSGRISSCELVILGVEIPDLDSDGLDDDWEYDRFGDLSQAATGDPDRDGRSNLREQILNTNPMRNETALAVDLFFLSNTKVRLSWPSHSAGVYRILASRELGQAFEMIGETPGTEYRTEWVVDREKVDYRFFQVKKVSN